MDIKGTTSNLTQDLGRLFLTVKVQVLNAFIFIKIICDNHSPIKPFCFMVGQVSARRVVARTLPVQALLKRVSRRVIKPTPFALSPPNGELYDLINQRSPGEDCQSNSDCANSTNSDNSSPPHG